MNVYFYPNICKTWENKSIASQFLLPYHVFRILFLSIEFLQKKRRFELTGICWFFQEQPLLHCQARKGKNIVMLLYLKLLRKYSLDQSIKAIDTKNQFVT